MKIKQLFQSKRIVYTLGLMPGELVKTYTYKGRRYVRIAFTNRPKYMNTVPMTDVLIKDVVGVRKLPSPFKKGMYNLVGLQPRPTYYKIQKLK